MEYAQLSQEQHRKEKLFKSSEGKESTSAVLVQTPLQGDWFKLDSISFWPSCSAWKDCLWTPGIELLQTDLNTTALSSNDMLGTTLIPSLHLRKWKWHLHLHVGSSKYLSNMPYHFFWVVAEAKRGDICKGLKIKALSESKNSNLENTVTLPSFAKLWHEYCNQNQPLDIGT